MYRTGARFVDSSLLTILKSIIVLKLRLRLNKYDFKIYILKKSNSLKVGRHLSEISEFEWNENEKKQAYI